MVISTLVDKELEVHFFLQVVELLNQASLMTKDALKVGNLKQVIYIGPLNPLLYNIINTFWSR